MSQPDRKLATPLSITIDLVLTAAVWCFFFTVLQPFVPSTEPQWSYLWAGLTAACLGGVFWMALQMFRVVFRFHRTFGTK